MAVHRLILPTLHETQVHRYFHTCTKPEGKRVQVWQGSGSFTVMQLSSPQEWLHSPHLAAGTHTIGSPALAIITKPRKQEVTLKASDLPYRPV
eukprot:3224331-Amphidinium_carterae.1